MLTTLIDKFDELNALLKSAISEDWSDERIQLLDREIDNCVQSILRFRCVNALEINQQMKFFTGLLEARDGNGSCSTVNSINLLIDRYIVHQVDDSEIKISSSKYDREDPNAKHDEFTIVIVDDSQGDVVLTQLSLESEGIESNCVSVLNPLDLIARLDELVNAGQKPEKLLILLDIHMPQQSGIETLRGLRSHSRYRNAAVVMLSSSTDDTHKAVAKEIGSEGFVQKPLDASLLRNSVNRLSKIKQQHLH